MIEITKYIFSSLDTMRGDIRSTKKMLNVCRADLNCHRTAIMMLSILGILTARDIYNNRKEILRLTNDIKNMKEKLAEKEKTKG